MPTSLKQPMWPLERHFRAQAQILKMARARHLFGCQVAKFSRASGLNASKEILVKNPGQRLVAENSSGDHSNEIMYTNCTCSKRSTQAWLLAAYHHPLIVKCTVGGGLPLRTTDFFQFLRMFSAPLRFFTIPYPAAIP